MGESFDPTKKETGWEFVNPPEKIETTLKTPEEKLAVGIERDRRILALQSVLFSIPEKNKKIYGIIRDYIEKVYKKKYPNDYSKRTEYYALAGGQARFGKVGEPPYIEEDDGAAEKFLEELMEKYKS